jgi:hypothetical protein
MRVVNKFARYLLTMSIIYPSMLKVDSLKAPEADIEAGSDPKSPRSLQPNSPIDNKT